MIQVITTVWGDKYSSAYVNGLFRAIKEHASEPLKLICMAEDTSMDFDDDIEVIQLSDLGRPFEEMKEGCRLKLNIFRTEVLDLDAPALFFDLDTAVIGDISVLAEQVRNDPRLYMLRNHLLPHWRFRWLMKLIKSQPYYYFGNASVIGFVPRQFLGALDEFREGCEIVDKGCDNPRFIKAHASDERFACYYARDHMQPFPSDLANKFSAEFMWPSKAINFFTIVINPFSSKRRKPVAITFDGDPFHPFTLSKLKEGQLIRHKYHLALWNFPIFQKYWRRVIGDLSD